MSHYALFAANIVAIALLVFGIYFPRHRRRDMIVAYLSINIGVLAISSVLASVEASVGLGVGLFGVLAIIRLRSEELDQREVAYYFASLALGLLGGTAATSDARTLALMGAVLVALWFGDHPRLLGHYETQVITLDRAITDEHQLRTYLSKLLGAKVRRVTVRSVNLVTDTTRVEVRFERETDQAYAGPPVPLPTSAAKASS